MRPLKALIVEDVETDAELLVLELRRGGFHPVYLRVDEPETFETALQSQEWEIIFCDHSLPGFSSMAALRILQKNGLDIPFIIISGTIGEESAVQALKAGANDYILKGNLAKLIPSIDKELREAANRAEHRTHLQQMQALFNSVSDLILITDDDGRFMDANPAAAMLLGLPRERILEESVASLFYHDAIEAFRTDWRDFIKKGRQSGEYTFQRPDGIILELDYIATANFIPHRHLSVLRDITQRKRSERALTESGAKLTRIVARERLLRQIVEIINSSFDINSILNTAAEKIGEFFEADRCFILRYTAEENAINVKLHGKYYRLMDVPTISPEDFPPELLKLLTQNLSIEDAILHQRFNTAEEYSENIKIKIQALPHLTDVEKTKYIEYFQNILIDKYCTQAYLKVGVCYRNIPYGAITLQQCRSRVWTDDEVDLLQNIATHIGVAFYQVKLFEEVKIRANQQEAASAIGQLALSNVDLPLLFTQTCENLAHNLEVGYAKILQCHPDQGTVECKAVYGFKNDLVGQIYDLSMEPLADLTLKSDKPLVMEDIETGGCRTPSLPHREYHLRSGVSVIIEGFNNCPYGVLQAECSEKRSFSNDDISFLQTLANVLAMTIERKHIEAEREQAKVEAEQANRKKSEFLSLMSHELRTPLNAILGYSRMVENGMAGSVNEKQVRYLQNVGASANHLLNIINDLLDISRVEAGKMTITPETIEIQALLEEVEAMMMELARKKTVSLSFITQPDIGSIEADPARFKQILINLVSNGIKFNRPGGTVQVRLEKTMDKQWLIGTVEDTGIGISQYELPKLFQRFYQTDTSSSRAQEGTGLGLALTKELVELHGGQISVESEHGAGSTFTFRLPAASGMIQWQTSDRPG